MWKVKSMWNKVVIGLAGSLYIVKQSGKWETLEGSFVAMCVIHIVHGGSNVPSLNGIIQEKDGLHDL